jgi:hypothetical protein
MSAACPVKGGNFGNANARGAAAVALKFGRDETELELPVVTTAEVLTGVAAMTASTPISHSSQTPQKGRAPPDRRDFSAKVSDSHAAAEMEGRDSFSCNHFNCNRALAASLRRPRAITFVCRARPMPADLR